MRWLIAFWSHNPAAEHLDYRCLVKPWDYEVTEVDCINLFTCILLDCSHWTCLYLSSERPGCCGDHVRRPVWHLGGYRPLQLQQSERHEEGRQVRLGKVSLWLDQNQSVAFHSNTVCWFCFSILIDCCVRVYQRPSDRTADEGDRGPQRRAWVFQAGGEERANAMSRSQRSL